MKKLSVRKERLTELSADDLRGLVAASPDGGSDRCTIIISDNSCVCGFDDGCNIEISNGSCVCTIELTA